MFLTDRYYTSYKLCLLFLPAPDILLIVAVMLCILLLYLQIVLFRGIAKSEYFNRHLHHGSWNFPVEELMILGKKTKGSRVGKAFSFQVFALEYSLIEVSLTKKNLSVVSVKMLPHKKKKKCWDEERENSIRILIQLLKEY